MKRMICLTVVLFVLLPISLAADRDIYAKQLESIDAERLYNYIPDGAEKIEFSRDVSLNDGLKNVWNTVREGIGEIFTSGLSCIISIIAISMLIGAVGAMSIPTDSPTVKMCVSLVGAIAVTTAAAGNVTSVIGMGRELISEINTFSKALLPTVAAAEVACGVPGTAVVKTTAAILFSDILITLINYVLIPLVYLNIFTATANAAAPNEAFKRISDLSVKVVSATLKLILGAFVSYVTVAGIVSGSIDKTGLKAAQLAASAIPVVGGIISDAAETVIGGAAILKNSIGIFGMLTILSACAIPFATLTINYCLFKIAAVCTAPIIDKGVSELTDRLGQCFGLILAMSASCVIVIFISIISAMRSVWVI